jgi:hypothetical protein
MNRLLSRLTAVVGMRVVGCLAQITLICDGSRICKLVLSMLFIKLPEAAYLFRYFLGYT